MAAQAIQRHHQARQMADTGAKRFADIQSDKKDAACDHEGYPAGDGPARFNEAGDLDSHQIR
jgi:hypothetical protein